MRGRTQSPPGARVFALRPLTLETQSRGKLHPHGHLYVAHSRVKNVASVHTYVAKYVAKGPSDADAQAPHPGTPAVCTVFCVAPTA
eukprot:scaffold51011_cov38-Phaeocystis_antarctica.AAC.1